MLQRLEAKFGECFAKLRAEGLAPSFREDVILTGYHGTSSDVPARIRREGRWKESPLDRRLGRGVYFYEDTEGLSGIESALDWAAHGAGPEGTGFQDPCVIIATISAPCIFDMTASNNHDYLSRFRSLLATAIYEIKNEFQLSDEVFNQGLGARLRSLDLQFAGQQISLRAPWQSSVTVIRSFFQTKTLKREVFGFVVRDQRCIEIQDVRNF